MPMNRARAIIIQCGSIALIERRRDGIVYYVFPGGKIEQGERPEDAVIREVQEELGLEIRVQRLVAMVDHGDIVNYYFVVEIVGGSFGTGTGPEVRGLYPPEHGTYHPLWLPLSELCACNVRHRQVADLVLSAQVKGWPDQPVEYS